MVVSPMLAVMTMIVISPGYMLIRIFFTGMAVHKAVPVVVIMFVKMVVRHPLVFMQMVMQMPVKMAVLVLMLQGQNRLAAALTKGIG